MAIPAPAGLPQPEELLISAACARAVGLDTLPAAASASARLRLLAERLRVQAPGAEHVSPGLLVGAATLQACLHALAADHVARDPSALDAVRAFVGPALDLDALAARYRLGALAHDDDGRLIGLLLLAALRANAALAPLSPLWSDPAPGASEALAALDGPPSPEPSSGLVDLLRSPAGASDDVDGQLAFLSERYGDRLPPALARAALASRDLLAEERAPRFGGPGPVEAPFVHGPPEEPAAFSEDRPWMPGVVLVAKQAFVWLDQLSRAHGRPITRLDEVPDSELDALASRGFTALWLIGLWERSVASRTIKRRCGNPEAEASAYALYDYVIATQLGGEDAWRDLSQRAGARGLRLASDMVPNHVGVDGRWVIDHPDWFVQLPHPPYPGYRYSGPDLSPDPDVGVFLEDGYWDRTDAAVVFKRLDRRTGEARFLYHGNDGTQMPWNDTAQLDYLNPAVREAVIQTILAVAKRFPIIRFDAAMTLARRHVQRLWHPVPGSGGAVPSRSEHGLSAAEFDAAMPLEFWREVVDRVAEEAPDTLLLAEAFWMMEGYFVRTLGMHRVYNSAFMHMLRDERTGEYRQMIKDVLATSPGILERFVNFVNNPDEDTACAQFGKGDKYFATATVLATLPGLPMFGHGQIEGFEEKYGMEYARAYTDEAPDEGFVAHHAQVIFPLLRRRELFSGVAHFALFDLVTHAGVDEAVLAYSNRDGDDRSLVIVNNRARATAGRLWLGAPTNVAGPDDDVALVTRDLVTALDLDDDAVHGLRALSTGLWFLRRGDALAAQGLDVQLGPYEAQVYMEWRALVGADWSALEAHLAGAGVPDLDVALAALSGPAAEGTDAAAGHELVAEPAGEDEAREGRGELVDRPGDDQVAPPEPV